MIEFHNVHKTYRVAGKDIPALHSTSLSVENGQVFGLIGHSGAGKSTLLRLINRLEEPSGGQIKVDGEEVTALDANGLRRFRQQVGMIFQQFNLLASKSVADNVALPLTLACELSRKEIDQRVAELLARVGLSDHANALGVVAALALALEFSPQVRARPVWLLVLCHAAVLLLTQSKTAFLATLIALTVVRWSW